MARKYFGTDGVRGLANRHPVTPEFALRLGRAAAARFSSPGGQRPSVVLGRDTRASCDLLESALAAGMLSAGADVLRVGVLPTPGVARLVLEYGARAGAMISASHNAFPDNGIKFFDADGFKLSDAAEEVIESSVDGDDAELPRPTGAGVGRARETRDAADHYAEYLRRTIPAGLRLDGMRLTVDCANGAAVRVAERVFSSLGADVFLLGDRPDGTNIMDGCGCLSPEACQAVVRDRGGIGITFDGDADRVLLVDEAGALVDGDQVLLACGSALHGRERLASNAVVGTVMSNFGLEAALASQGIRLIRSAVGDRYVLDEMRRAGATLGGEPSGHVIFLEHGTTGDGLLTSLQVLALCAERRATLREVTAGIERFPQVLLNVRVREKPELAGIPRVASAISAAERSLADSGRILVRYSGTELLARVMVEGRDAVLVQSTAERVADEIRSALGA